MSLGINNSEPVKHLAASGLSIPLNFTRASAFLKLTSSISNQPSLYFCSLNFSLRILKKTLSKLKNARIPRKNFQLLQILRPRRCRGFVLLQANPLLVYNFKRITLSRLSCTCAQQGSDRLCDSSLLSDYLADVA